MNQQPVSLADQLRKLVERWRELARKDEEDAADYNKRLGLGEIITVTNGRFKDLREVCSDELSALLDQHAVAEPQNEKWHGFIGGLNGNPEFCKYCGEPEQSYRHAHAAEQPKLTEEQVRMAVETFKQDYFGMAQALNALPKRPLTSPVAPPPPVYFANSHAVWDVSKIPAELVYPSPAVPADYHCTFCDGNHFENLCPNRCKPEDAAPPVAPGEQPPQGRPANDTSPIYDAETLEKISKLQTTDWAAQERAKGRKANEQS